MEISTLLDLILILAAIFYLLVHLCLIAGLHFQKNTKINSRPFVSVIVAARNEEQTIGKLLECLLHQTYQEYEIIIINDRSTDKTAEIVSGFQKENLSIKLIDITSIPTGMPAKKNALNSGINLSKGDILCFTDSDCFPPPTWIEGIVQLFQPEVGLIAGYSPYQIPSNEQHINRYLKKIFFKFVAYEEFRAAIWSAGSIGCNYGWLCTGRNLAYRRIVFDEVGGYDKIKLSVSGDDDLFLQLVRRKTAWKIRYSLMKDTFVPTLPPHNFSAFVEQRKRHFSAAKYFTMPMMLFFFFYHVSNLLLFVSPLLVITDLLSWPIAACCIGTKLLSDSILISSSMSTFNNGILQGSYIYMEALYVFYNSFIGPLGLIRKFEWKQT